MSRTIEAVRDELGATSWEAIEVWRQGAAGSASHDVAHGNASRETHTPTYAARCVTTQKETALAADEYTRLLQAGAVDIPKPVPKTSEE